MISNQDVQKNWTDIKAKIKAKWSNFNDLELESFKSNLHKLPESLERSYGLLKTQADADYNDFVKSIESLTTDANHAPKSQAV